MRIRRPIHPWRPLGIVVIAGLVGCSDAFPTAPVSGVITLDGQRLAEARVAFEPIAQEGEMLAGPGSYGKTDREGRYTLATVHGEPGAVVGRHRVSISTSITPPRGPEGEDMEPTQEKVPERYRDGTSPLEFTVPPGGTSAADFKLEHD